MKEEERVCEIIRLLKEEYPNAKIALNFSNPLELLVAVILSAQCTDKKVNEVTTDLFKKYRIVEDYAYAPPEEFEGDIKPTGFYHNKARNIIAAANMIIEKFNGQIPRTMDEILELPGVARKTANIVLGNAYGLVEGVAVDTHVKRVTFRLAFTKEKDPVKIEKDMMRVLPKEEWFPFTYVLIDHGRAICAAINVRCDICPVNHLCPSAFKV
ncbi:MAG: endonuclease III [Actinomycetota bacterium]